MATRKKKRRERPLTTLKKMRKAAERADARAIYIGMFGASPFSQLWQFVSFLAEQRVHGKRRSTVLRRIDAAIARLGSLAA